MHLQQGLRIPVVIPHTFDDDGFVPNSSLPVLLYRYAFTGHKVTQDTLEKMIAKSGWRVDWVNHNAVYRYPHYHLVHEILVVLEGEARIRLGGDEGADISVRAHDIIAIPAGVAHQRIGDGRKFTVAGLYQASDTWTTLKQNDTNYRRAKIILADLSPPHKDPFYGEDGPLVLNWTPEHVL